jgi:hypothetical protein
MPDSIPWTESTDPWIDVHAVALRALHAISLRAQDPLLPILEVLMTLLPQPLSSLEEVCRARSLPPARAQAWLADARKLGVARHLLGILTHAALPKIASWDDKKLAAQREQLEVIRAIHQKLQQLLICGATGWPSSDPVTEKDLQDLDACTDALRIQTARLPPPTPEETSWNSPSIDAPLHWSPEENPLNNVVPAATESSWETDTLIDLHQFLLDLESFNNAAAEKDKTPPPSLDEEIDFQLQLFEDVLQRTTDQRMDDSPTTHTFEAPRDATIEKSDPQPQPLEDIPHKATDQRMDDSPTTRTPADVLPRQRMKTFCQTRSLSLGYFSKMTRTTHASSFSSILRQHLFHQQPLENAPYKAADQRMDDSPTTRTPEGPTVHHEPLSPDDTVLDALRRIRTLFSADVSPRQKQLRDCVDVLLEVRRPTCSTIEKFCRTRHISLKFFGKVKQATHASTFSSILRQHLIEMCKPPFLTLAQARAFLLSPDLPSTCPSGWVIWEQKDVMTRITHELKCLTEGDASAEDSAVTQRILQRLEQLGALQEEVAREDMSTGDMEQTIAQQLATCQPGSSLWEDLKLAQYVLRRMQTGKAHPRGAMIALAKELQISTDEIRYRTSQIERTGLCPYLRRLLAEPAHTTTPPLPKHAPSSLLFEFVLERPVQSEREQERVERVAVLRRLLERIDQQPGGNTLRLRHCLLTLLEDVDHTHKSLPDFCLVHGIPLNIGRQWLEEAKQRGIWHVVAQELINICKPPSLPYPEALMLLNAPLPGQYIWQNLRENSGIVEAVAEEAKRLSHGNAEALHLICALQRWLEETALVPPRKRPRTAL